MEASVHILGIRHHGPGSSRHLLRALNKLKPDLLLVEGAYEANNLTSFVNPKDLKPPVALIIYEEQLPEKAVFYPFAEYSPEFQAILWANENHTRVEFADLPLSIRPELSKPENAAQNNKIRRDPFRLLTAAAGFSDIEKWWEHLIEKKNEADEVFQAILNMIAEIRNFEPEEDPETLLRESFMRFRIAQSVKDGFRNIVFICGAWHSSALSDWQRSEREDAKNFKKIPKGKFLATWIPWTYEKLALESGYGAGVRSPRWYELMWKNREKSGEIFMIEAANLLRNKGFDTSSAAVIEAVKLAEMLSFIREMHLPGLEELRDAAKSVLCEASEEVFECIENELIVGNEIGSVSEKIPLIPLQQDFNKIIKSLRIVLKQGEQTLSLDLRNDLHREKSRFLNRLKLLKIPLARTKPVYNALGTFHENWLLEWKPTAEIALIEANVWGNTVLSAAIARSMYDIKEAKELAAVSEILQILLRADLKECLPAALQKLDETSILHSDILDLMRAVPPLVNITAYGDVRKTDTELIDNTLFRICERVFAGLPSATGGINEESAVNFYEQTDSFNTALQLWGKLTEDWLDTLKKTAFSESTHQILSGQATRILFDAGALTGREMLRQVEFRLNFHAEAQENALWLEGFIGTKPQILIYDDELRDITDTWLLSLDEDNFLLVLPMVRRIFSQTDRTEREKILESILQRRENKSVSAHRKEQNFELLRPFLERFLPL